jgi:hypothetical protein
MVEFLLFIIALPVIVSLVIYGVIVLFYLLAGLFCILISPFMLLSRFSLFLGQKIRLNRGHTGSIGVKRGC